MDDNSSAHHDHRTRLREPSRDFQGVQQPVSTKRTIAIYGFMLLMHLMLAIDTTSIVVALPTIAREMQADERAVFSMGTVFALVATISQQPLAEISHVLGRKPAVLMTLNVFFLGSVVAATGNSMAVLLVGRGMQGFASGGAGLSNLILTDLLGLRDRAAWMPIQNIVWAVGLVCGPILGVSLMRLSWRWLFWINLAPITISWVGLFFLLGFDRPEGGAHENLHRVDWVGMCLFVPSAVSILLPIIMGGAFFVWSSWKAMLPLALGIFGLLVLAYHQHYMAKNPMFRGVLFTQRTAVSCYMGQAVFGICLNIVLYYIVLFWAGVRQLTSLRTGLALMPQLIGIPTAAIIAGLIMRSTGQVGWAMYFGWPLTAVSLGLLWFMDTTTPLAILITINTGIGFGSGMVASAMGCATLSVNRRKNQGHAMAMSGLFRSAGTTVGIAVGTNVFSTVIQGKLANLETNFSSEELLRILEKLKEDPKVMDALVDTLRILWLICTGLCLLGTILAWTCQYPNLKARELEEDEEEQRRKMSATWVREARLESCMMTKGKA